MDGARPGYIPRGDMPGIYHTLLPDGWEYVVNPYYDPFSPYKSCALPYAFRKISTGHVQLRYPVCPDFEKAIYGATIPGTAIFSFELYVDDDDSHVLADSDSSDGNISGDDSSSSVEHMPFWGVDDESNDGSSAFGGSADSVSRAFRCPCGLSHLHYFLNFRGFFLALELLIGSAMVV